MEQHHLEQHHFEAQMLHFSRGRMALHQHAPLVGAPQGSLEAEDVDSSWSQTTCKRRLEGHFKGFRWFTLLWWVLSLVTRVFGPYRLGSG